MKNNAVGRPKKELDWRLIDSILQYGASLVDCSDICEMSEDSVQNKIKAKYGVTFSEYRDRKKSKMRMKLRQKQFDLALKGNVPLLIWLGKQELGQSDRAENTNTDKIEITIDSSDSEL